MESAKREREVQGQRECNGCGAKEGRKGGRETRNRIQNALDKVNKRRKMERQEMGPQTYLYCKREVHQRFPHFHHQIRSLNPLWQRLDVHDVALEQDPMLWPLFATSLVHWMGRWRQPSCLYIHARRPKTAKPKEGRIIWNFIGSPWLGISLTGSRMIPSL